MQVSSADTHNEAEPARANLPAPKAVDEMSAFIWILLGIVYVACWIYFGMTTFRKGHYWMFWIGFFFPILWIIGALIAPTPAKAGLA